MESKDGPDLPAYGRGGRITMTFVTYIEIDEGREPGHEWRVREGLV